ncbi:alpha-amylase family glycosyl hydrolase [Lactobacillus delbrueckii]|uniref:alpha-amylase family glycosyl hydrolase n=1 Tax=Lactobacillus delbrueckii TaxID=1584 RepID=UPI0027E2BAEA|nr:alpha-amylase family glycosyl hydrolase [Lactobacillus delbrueckii]
MVYQIFPDRFNNGNPHGEIQGRKKDSFIYATKEDSPYYIKDGHGDIARWDFFGGNLEGIRQKIPYLKDLGVTAIYLNPIFQASSNHRYDTQDFIKIDPMLETEEDFKNLIKDLHKNRIALILEGTGHLLLQQDRPGYDPGRGKISNILPAREDWRAGK